MARLVKLLNLTMAGESMQMVAGSFERISEGGKLSTTERDHIGATLTLMALICKSLDEQTVATLLEERVDPEEPDWFPSDKGSWEMLSHAFLTAVRTKQTHFVEQERAKYFDQEAFIPSNVSGAFPGPFSELKSAGRAYCFNLYDAVAFHCMRAVEIGARSLAIDLECEFKAPLDQVDLHPLLNQCDTKIKEKKELPKSVQKAADLEFYSTAASNFRYFKDGWRIRATHGRATFQREEAEALLTRTAEFFGVISKRLKE